MKAAASYGIISVNTKPISTFFIMILSSISYKYQMIKWVQIIVFDHYLINLTIYFYFSELCNIFFLIFLHFLFTWFYWFLFIHLFFLIWHLFRYFLHNWHAYNQKERKYSILTPINKFTKNLAEGSGPLKLLDSTWHFALEWELLEKIRGNRLMSIVIIEIKIREKSKWKILRSHKLLDRLTQNTA